MRKGRRVTAGLLVLVAGAVMFEVPGAWLFAQGLPWWGALALAALGFPVVPVAWHLLGERKRRRRLAAAAASAKPGAKPTTSSLTGGDRFTLRLLAVALVTLGPILFFRGGEAWQAVKDHPLWFVPQAPAGPRTFEGDRRLIGQVPADAELVIWARGLDEVGGAGSGADGEPEAQEVVIAYRAGAVLAAVRGPDKALPKLDLDEANRELAKQPWLPVKGPLVARRRASDVLVVVSEGWAEAVDDRAAGRTDGPAAILARLSAAPSDAVVITAAAPARPVAGLDLTAMQSWLRVSERAIRIDADFFVRDAAAATALVARMEAEKRELAAAASADCRPKVEALLREVLVVRGETMVKVAAYWKPEQVGQAVFCAVGALMEQADWKPAPAAGG